MTPRDELIATLHQQGLSQRQIAKQIGLSQPGVRKRLIRLGLITSKPRSDNSPRTEQTAANPASGNHQDNTPCEVEKRACADNTPAPDNQGAPPAELKGDQDTPPPAVGDNHARADNPSTEVMTSPAGRNDAPLVSDNCLSAHAVELPPILQQAEDGLQRLRAAAKSGSAPKLLEEAAEGILSVMNPSLADFFRDRCWALNAKPWQVICAIVHRSCELRQIDYYPDTFGIKDPEAQPAKTLCRNCGQDIPDARWGQLYCCNKCSAYHQGSKVVQFGQHSPECPIVGQPWRAGEG